MNASRLRTSVATRIGIAALVTALLLAPTGCSVLTATRGTSTESSVGGAPVVLPSEQAAPAVGAADSALTIEKSHGTAAESAAYGTATPGQEQLLVRTASMRLRVEDIDKTLQRIRAATAQFKGQIDDLQVSTESDVPIYRPLVDASGSQETVPLSAYVTVRVPSAQLAAFSRRVSSFGTVLRESANQSDVTQQHIDMTARLKNLRAEEARLRQFLKEAKNVREMLLVETELSRVRGEIESMQTQLDYLDRQISYGTLTVELQKPAPVVRPAGTDWGFSQAITDGIRGAAAALRSLITVAIALSPLILVVVVVALVVRWIVRRRRRRAGASYDETPGDEAWAGEGPDTPSEDAAATAQDS